MATLGFAWCLLTLRSLVRGNADAIPGPFFSLCVVVFGACLARVCARHSRSVVKEPPRPAVTAHRER